MKSLSKKIASLALGAAAMLIACQETTTIGSSLTTDDVEIVIDSTFTCSGQSIESNAVLSRTITQLLGRIDAPGFGTLSSDVVTQFMPAIEIDTTGITRNDIDSIKLVCQVSVGAFTGDSLAPMGLEVYKLTKALPSPIYSDFDPSGYYDSKKPIGSLIYNLSAVGESDSIQELSYRQFDITLPVEEGRKLFDAYKANPATFASPTAFANIFQGLYIKNSYGSGRVTRIAKTTMRMYYHHTYYDEDRGKDTTVYNTGVYFAVTPEIISNNNIHIDLAPEIKTLAKTNTVLAAPAGLDVQFQFPGREIAESYRANAGRLAVINTLTLTIPAEAIANKYNLPVPPSILMVLSNKKDEFFIKNSLTDSKTSFYANYDSTNKQYVISDMRDYIIDLLSKDEITDDDVTFTITPVLISTETVTSSYTETTYVSQITPYVQQPVLGKISLDKAKIKFTYSKQTIKN